MSLEKNKKWHSLPLKKVLTETGFDKNGLSLKKINAFGKKFGKNSLPTEQSYSKLKLFFNQFNSSLIYILLSTVFISLFLKHYSDAFFILFVLFINTSVNFYQENKANQSLQQLRKMVTIKTRVLRNGNEREVDSYDLVPGDLVFLKAGDKIPADGRLLDAKNLIVNEANLTGESMGVTKESIDSLPENTPLQERKNTVFMGTVVEEGRGSFVVTTTGANSQIGEIMSMLKETSEPKTPLQKKIADLSRRSSAGNYYRFSFRHA